MGRKPKKNDQHFVQETVATTKWGLTLTKSEAEQVVRKACADVMDVDAERSFVMPVKATLGGEPSYMIVLSIKLPLGMTRDTHVATAIVAENLALVEELLRDMFPAKFSPKVKVATTT